MTRRSRVLRLARAVGHELRAEQVTFLAGSIAYHAFVSLLPAALLAVVVLSAVTGIAPRETIISLVASAVTDGAADALVGELERASQSRGLSVVGVGVLLWGTLRVFRGLDAAFSAVYETESANGFLDQLVDGTIVLLAVAGAVAVGTVLVDVVPGENGVVARAVRWLAIVLGLTVSLLPLYYVFPDADVGVVEVLPGTAVAAVGLALGESAFSLYVAWSSSQPTASVVAALVVFLTWLYVSGLILLVGAAINAVLSNRSEDVSVEPVLGGPSPAAAVGGSDDQPTESAVRRAVADAHPGDGTPPDAVERIDTDDGVIVELHWETTATQSDDQND